MKLELDVCEIPSHLAEFFEPVLEMKPKDLLGIPFRVAFALQADGWWLRSDIVWSKRNCMPESVEDRPTRSHEYIFMLTKNERYFYDHVAIREKAVYGVPNAPDAIKSPYGQGYSRRAGKPDKQRGHSRRHDGFNDRWDHMTKAEQIALGRNKRSVWEIATQPYPESHFAVFPEKLVEPCILAGTSEKGCCAKCGAPWVRIFEKKNIPDRPNRVQGRDGDSLKKAHGQDGRAGNRWNVEVQSVGWAPSCSCDAGIVSCVVLDPFMGSGTTALVAIKARRNFVGIELSKKYADMANRRIAQEMDQGRLF